MPTTGATGKFILGTPPTLASRDPSQWHVGFIVVSTSVDTQEAFHRGDCVNLLECIYFYIICNLVQLKIPYTYSLIKNLKDHFSEKFRDVLSKSK